MASSLEADPLIGRLLAHKFKIERLLGAGAMGRVYLAEQTNLGKQVALKVLHASMAGDAQLAKRFYREAKSASMLSHPNILQIIDFGDDAGLLFIAMELLTGRDLYRVIKDQFPFSLDRVGHIGGQILGALDEAHAKGVVHRDLKPENVMLLDVRGESDFVKVCDFGIAKVASERDGEGSAITMAGMVCGTPEYMSPEQARGEPLDGRSDLYAAAVILYQMVAGDVPFRAESALGVITKHLTEEPTPPSQRRSKVTVPPAVEALILRGLRKAKEERFASAAEMKSALLEATGMKRGSSASGQPRAAARASDAATAATGVATPVSAPAMAATAAATSTPPQPSSGSVHGELAATPPTSARRSGVLAALLALVVTLGGGAYVLVGKRPPMPTGVTATPSATATAPASTTAAAALPVAPARTLPEPPAPPLEPPPAIARSTMAPPTPTAGGRAHKRDKPLHASSSGAGTSSGKASVAARAVPAPTAASADTVAARPAVAPGPFGDGEALFRSGDVDGALARYQEAARLNPSDARTQRQIGKCYNRLGQRDRAQPYLKKYLELAPDASDAAFIRAMLDGK